MAKDFQRLKKIFLKTDGHCHICYRRLTFRSYGIPQAKRTWQQDHSIPKAVGGSNHLNNLYPACASCNQKKGIKSSRSARAIHGFKRAPLSKAKKESIKSNNITVGMILGGIIGASGGTIGILLGATLGGLIGKERSPVK